MGNLTLDSSTPGVLYVMFYVFAFLAGMLLLLVEGRRRGYPLTPWVLTIFSGFLFFVIGCKVFMFSNETWWALLRGLEVPDVTGRTLIGGLVFGLAGILLAVRWFRLPWSVLDSFAFVVPFTLLFQRVGCFLAGCCYGTPTAMPWGVKYGTQYQAWHDHVDLGLIEAASGHAHAVHPVQLYEVAGCVIIIIVIHRIRKAGLFKASGSLLLLSTALYGIVRFCDEFFRATHQPVAAGLNKVQYLVAMIAVVSLLLILVLERSPADTKPSNLPARHPVRFSFVFFILLGSLYSLSWSFIDTLEVLALYPVVMVSTGAILHSVYYQMTYSVSRFAVSIMVVLSLALMSQIVSEKEEKNLEQRHYYTVALDVLSGKHTLDNELSNADCDGNESYTLARFKERYTSAGLNFSRTDVRGDRKLTYGIGSQIGRLEEKGEGNVNSLRQLNFYAITPWFRYDFPWFGIGGGASVGDMPVIKSHFDTPQATLIRRYRVYPQLYVRGGSARTFFGEFRLGEGFAGAFPASQYQLMSGYGFHRDNGAAIRLGTSSHAAVVLSGTIPAGDRLLIEPFLGFGQSMFTDYTSATNFQGSVRFAYRFGDFKTSE